MRLLISLFFLGQSTHMRRTSCATPVEFQGKKESKNCSRFSNFCTENTPQVLWKFKKIFLTKVILKIFWNIGWWFIILEKKSVAIKAELDLKSDILSTFTSITRETRAEPDAFTIFLLASRALLWHNLCSLLLLQEFHEWSKWRSEGSSRKKRVLQLLKRAQHAMSPMSWHLPFCSWDCAEQLNKHSGPNKEKIGLIQNLLSINGFHGMSVYKVWVAIHTYTYLR